MQTQEHSRHRYSRHDLGAARGQGRGPAVFYGYCHESGQMRMMDLPDFVDNTQTTYSNMVSGMSSVYQPYMDMLQGSAQQARPAGQRQRRHQGHHDDCGCRSHCCEQEHDCHCSCCIRCADVVEYARCEELRLIPVTFENDTRRERDVKLELGPFVTEDGRELWRGDVSEPSFKLPPCGEKTILIRVLVNCGSLAAQPPGGAGGPNDPPATVPPRNERAAVDSCKVAYATLRAEGCIIRPLVIAVAVLPNDCGAHRAGCQCGCCC
jgi:hypothetical protein